ncbi:MAG: NosD domain-containing protein, partial [archaeon]
GGFVIDVYGSIVCDYSVVASDQCSGTQSLWVHEYTTDGYTYNYTSVYCPDEGFDHCEDGACVEPFPTNCTDTDGGFVIETYGEIVCDGTTMASDECSGGESRWVHEYTLDITGWDWESIFCPSQGYNRCNNGECIEPFNLTNQTYTDTDGGIVLDERGFILLSENGTLVAEDSCGGTTEKWVREWFTDGDTYQMISHYCPYYGFEECHNGACVEPTGNEVECGDIIDKDFYMYNDLLNCPGNGLIIGADDITLDCNGHSISGDSVGTDFGVHLNLMDGVTIKNCNIEGFHTGIFLQTSDFNTIIDNNLMNNQNGVKLATFSDSNSVFNNTMDYNSVEGLGIYSSDDNLITYNDMRWNGNGGISLWDCSDNIIWANNFTGNPINAYENPNANNNDWNTTIGNFWSDFESNEGYPTHYIITGPGDGIDWNPVGSFIPTCSDGTVYGECSSAKPKYCDDGILINKCQQCGCPKKQWCKMDGSCQGIQELIPMSPMERP